MTEFLVKKELRVLILEDATSDAELMEHELRGTGLKFSARRVETREDFVAALETFVPDLILADYRLPTFDGLSALKIVRERSRELPFIFVTGAMGEEVAIETLKSGATDYVLKDRLSKLVPAVERALREVEELAQRRQAEEALRLSEARLRTALRAARIVVFHQDRELRYTWIQDYGAGFSAAQVLGKRDRDLLAPEDAETLETLKYAVLEHGAGVRQEVRLHQQGAERFYDLTLEPLRDAQGGMEGLLGAATEVTEYRQLHEQLRAQAVQLAETDRRKDEFLATLAHELRNPLAPISNALQLLKRGGASPAVIESVLGMAERQVGQLVRLVDDLLDISRITRGKITLHKARVTLQAVIQIALETSRPQIKAAGHQLTVEMPEEPVNLEADLTRLAQAVSNLLINAAKFTEAGGHIQLRAHCEGQEVLIAVQDNGIGIPAAQLPKVFDLFAQIEQPPGHRRGGLGIGLALVKSLVEMHGGRVEVASAGLGQGSTFTVRLPPYTEQPSREPSDEACGIATTPKVQVRRILVVDDDADVANSMAMLLETCGHQVHIAYDGVTALEIAREHRPEVILLDIGMPGMSGYEVARRLRQQPELHGTLLIALTGWGQEADRQRACEAGFDHHLVKPVDLAALEALLRRDTQPLNA